MSTLGTCRWAFMTGWTRDTCKNKMIQLKKTSEDEQLDFSTDPYFDDVWSVLKVLWWYLWIRFVKISNSSRWLPDSKLSSRSFLPKYYIMCNGIQDSVGQKTLQGVIYRWVISQNFCPSRADYLLVISIVDYGSLAPAKTWKSSRTPGLPLIKVISNTPLWTCRTWRKSNGNFRDSVLLPVGA